MKIFRVITYLLAVCALAAAGVGMFHAINPTLMARRFQWLVDFPSTWVTAGFGSATLALSFILYCVAHHQAGGGFATSKTAGATTLAIIGLAAMLTAVVITINYPLGVLGVEIHKAPLQKKQVAEDTIATVVGDCTNGWVELGETDIHGLTFGVVCASTKTAYMEFDSPITAGVFKSSIKQAGPVLMRNYDSATWSPQPTHYDALTGQLWVAITPTGKSLRLQAAIGGQLEPLQ